MMYNITAVVSLVFRVVINQEGIFIGYYHWVHVIYLWKANSL